MSSHQLSASTGIDSTTPPPLTSLSSEASVKLYEEQLKPKINTIKSSNASLPSLVDAAEKIIREVFQAAPDPMRTFTFTHKKPEDQDHYEILTSISVHLDKVMLAMLAYAQECGGESGKRYVAAAIVSCSKEDSDADVVGALAALGTTWLTHLLFVFKTRTQTIDQPSTHFSQGGGSRKRSVAQNVIKRDRYECVLTGTQDVAHPKPVAGIYTARLYITHILQRALGEFDTDQNSDSYKSAATTLDILSNFTRLPAQTLEELSVHLDEPSNGMTLQSDAHYAFERFDWCLKQTMETHVYDFKIFQDRGILRKPDDNRITFADHSDDFSDSDSDSDSDSGSTLKLDSKRKPPVDLPNPIYIQIHAAIAGILNMSGAGRFLDALLDTYREDEDRLCAVRCWPELERLMEEQVLRDAVTEAFRMANVY
ncbi:hypothetical protein GALMADRAFT_251878 [Galerina marginata CBS 339.88]|uniref:HNH nuclease domain-containing protein n=1 Tax=Galerina marginata (strain CBS 339.88) TaxID=685588 RepID=A0A067SQV8_GALM3|nr:hypothetical protein GALMADRAFT_251878 [Galerina marginata CBS 339.88]